MLCLGTHPNVVIGNSIIITGTENRNRDLMTLIVMRAFDPHVHHKSV